MLQISYSDLGIGTNTDLKLGAQGPALSTRKKIRMPPILCSAPATVGAQHIAVENWNCGNQKALRDASAARWLQGGAKKKLPRRRPHSQGRRTAKI